MIRRAKAVDVPRMVELVHDGAQISIEAGRLTFDATLVRQTVFQCVTHARGWAAVAEVNEQVEGLLCGMLQPVYCCAVELEATDLFWLGTDRCPARDKVGLMLAFVEWAKQHPKCARIMCAATAVLVENSKAGRILEKIGFKNFGTIYRMEVA